MATPIASIGIQPSIPTMPTMPGSAPSAAQPAEGSQPSFKDMLLDSIKEVNSMQQQADKAVDSLATRGDVNPAEVLTAVQKADIAFRMMMQVRNKLVAAFDEVRNIRV